MDAKEVGAGTVRTQGGSAGPGSFQVRDGKTLNWRTVCGLTAPLRDSDIRQNETEL